MNDTKHTFDHHFLKIKVSTSSLPEQSLFFDDSIEEKEENPIETAPLKPVAPIFNEEVKLEEDPVAYEAIIEELIEG